MALPLRISEREERIYTAAEFMALPLDNKMRYELVRGVIKEMSHPGEEHMLVADNLYFTLGNFVRARHLGRVLPPGGFELRIPGALRDTVRSPDLTFLAEDKITWQRGAIKAAPELAVEIYSANNRPGEMREKLKDYQSAGWQLVWIIYPPKSAPKNKAGKVEVYHLQQNLKPVRVLGLEDELDGEEVIPGFKMAVKALFV